MAASLHAPVHVSDSLPRFHAAAHTASAAASGPATGTCKYTRRYHCIHPYLCLIGYLAFVLPPALPPPLPLVLLLVCTAPLTPPPLLPPAPLLSRACQIIGDSDGATTASLHAPAPVSDSLPRFHAAAHTPSAAASGPATGQIIGDSDDSAAAALPAHLRSKSRSGSGHSWHARSSSGARSHSGSVDDEDGIELPEATALRSSA
ncbi:hypothetical protein JKP88DRAFT_293698 [Tribonema minus]|uniref:Uncharacterized protein n=1 Tax=Tribonema minus TaxID=303371 RepID=A0A836CNW1_9STRA|nr:hypothetical protein JKP88DRAFT_293698 [Tribonema minus]